MNARRFIEQNIAQHFTDADGSTLLYIGRENVLPGIAAWPIPFDAPFKPQLDSIMMAVLQVIIISGQAKGAFLILNFTVLYYPILSLIS